MSKKDKEVIDKKVAESEANERKKMRQAWKEYKKKADEKVAAEKAATEAEFYRNVREQAELLRDIKGLLEEQKK